MMFLKNPESKGLGNGYDFDVVNSDVILNRMSVKDGRLVLPDGMSYAIIDTTRSGADDNGSPEKNQ